MTLGVIYRLASLTVNKALPDSITEWGILAVSASPNTGREEGLISVSQYLLSVFLKKRFYCKKNVSIYSRSLSKIVIRFVFLSRLLCCQAVQCAGMEAFLRGSPAAVLGGQERAGGDQSCDPQLRLRGHARKPDSSAHLLLCQAAAHTHHWLEKEGRFQQGCQC